MAGVARAPRHRGGRGETAESSSSVRLATEGTAVEAKVELAVRGACNRLIDEQDPQP